MTICADSPQHWIDHYCYTLDPREQQAVLPFDLFPKQAEFIDWLRDRERLQQDGLCEKSRDMGASWLCCAYALHGWLFRPSFTVGFGSRKLEYVDEKGNPKSIFEKFRIILRGLPAWMMPRGFHWKNHDCHAKLINPQNGAVITGEGGDDIGRGDRTSLYFVDEAAFLERPQMVERSLSQTTRCRIDVSTPNGPGNPFATKRHSGKVAVFTFHWKQDPRKGEEWYAEQVRRFDPVTVAQEIDIDYSASVEGITIPAAWVRAAVHLAEWARAKGIVFPETGPIIAGLDIAEEGKNRSVFVARQGPLVRYPVDWGQLNTTATAYKAADEAEHAGVTILNYDCGGPGAGVRGTYQTTERKFTFTTNAILAGSSPTEARWPDGKTSKERFLNLRAEMWWTLRSRFEKAYEFRENGVLHPVEDMISIPAHQELIAQLSQPLTQHMDTGKMKVESKSDMRKRGVASPDFADALCLAFVPDGKRKFNMFI